MVEQDVRKAGIACRRSSLFQPGNAVKELARSVPAGALISGNGAVELVGGGFFSGAVGDVSVGEVVQATILRAIIRAETGRLMRLNDIEDSLCGY
jgi:hypothetical protein